MAKKFGIDISRWQGDFNINQAKAEGVEFVIIKCGGGDAGLYKDGQFENNYKKAKAAGLPVGAYWFSRALTVEEAKKEAEYCYNLLKGKQFELPIYIDVENNKQLAVGKRTLTDIIHTFLQYLEDKHYYVGIYSSASFFNTYMYDTELQRYDHWVASWGTKQPTNAAMGMWQFGGETNKIRSNKICGQTVDQDYLFKDYSIIKTNKFNGFGEEVKPVEVKPVEPPKAKDIATLAAEVLQGKHGNGEDRKKSLGTKYAEVQELVNNYCKIQELLK